MSKPIKLHYNEMDCFTICGHSTGRLIDDEIKYTYLLEKFLTADNKYNSCNRILKLRGIVK